MSRFRTLLAAWENSNGHSAFKFGNQINWYRQSVKLFQLGQMWRELMATEPRCGVNRREATRLGRWNDFHRFRVNNWKYFPRFFFFSKFSFCFLLFCFVRLEWIMQNQLLGIVLKQATPRVNKYQKWKTGNASNLVIYSFSSFSFWLCQVRCAGYYSDYVLPQTGMRLNHFLLDH